MKKRFTIIAVAAFMLAFVFTANCMADEVGPNIPITADQAFDAVVKQVDPDSGDNARVALIDVRTAAEYFWVGACAKVNSITTDREREYIPYNGKVKLMWGKYLSFKVERRHRLRRVFLPIKKVAAVDTEEISLHIPLKTWNEANVALDLNEAFNDQIESLAGEYDVLILMCRSGIRSDYTGFDRSLFSAVYEIDQPDGKSGRGGFQGTSYGDAYNGYRGYPGRSTRRQDHPSVSWSDTGLPVHTSWAPITVTLPEPDPEDDGPIPDPEDDGIVPDPEGSLGQPW